MNERNRRERESTAHELNRMNEPEWTEEASDKELPTQPLPRATQMELLAPAGGPAPFTAALAGGADAIYCGLGNNFNARRGADNFDDESFARACRQAHLAGARVYVTVNVVVKWDEMQRVLRLIRRAWVLGADAFIIQDWGLMAQVRKTWPEIECHVSTQANIHDTRGVAACKKLGVGRVTLSRELTKEEISTISKLGVELECFGHGALCFCYSGICHMSSMRGDRSANRGACAQPCRLPYELLNSKHEVVSMGGIDRLLCPKDYCTIDDVPDMIEAGVGSLKIEGRMKAPEYVYSVVSSYRQAIDAAEKGVDNQADVARRHRLLKRSFNRGLTNAYLHGTAGNEMMSYERSNNRGEIVGEVTGGRPLEDALERKSGLNGGRVKLRRYKQADVDLIAHAPIGKNDLLEIRPLDEPDKFLTALCPVDVEPGQTVTVRTSRVMQTGSTVRIIRSEAARVAAEQISSLEYPRKRAVDVAIIARIGQPFTVALTTADGAASASAEGFVVEEARTKAVTSDELIEHVGRMGTSPFEAVSFDVQMDDTCGMSFSAVHKVRAAACEQLETALLEEYQNREQKIAPLSRLAYQKEREAQDKEKLFAFDEAAAKINASQAEVCVLVETPEQARVALKAGADRLYATTDALAETSWPEDLLAKVTPWLDEVCREIDHKRLDPYVAAGKPVAVGNISELALAVERGAIPEVRECIPVHNDYALQALADMGADGVWLNSELTLQEICHMARNASIPVGYMVSGRIRTMTTEHCILMSTGKCIHDCDACKLRLEEHTLRGIDNDYMPVRTDRHGRSKIWSPKLFDGVPEMAEMLSCGVKRFMVDATLLSTEQTKEATSRVAAAIAATASGASLPARLKDASVGHLFSPIG